MKSGAILFNTSGCEVMNIEDKAIFLEKDQIIYNAMNEQKKLKF